MAGVRWADEETLIAILLKTWGFTEEEISQVLTQRWAQVRGINMIASFLSPAPQYGRTKAAVHAQLTAIGNENPFLKNPDGTWNLHSISIWSFYLPVYRPLLLQILNIGMEYPLLYWNESS